LKEHDFYSIKSIMPESDNTMRAMMSRLPHPGKVAWIGLRPQRRVKMTEVQQVNALGNYGLEGDRTATKKGSKRQVTLIMSEHIEATAMILGKESIDPGLLRRNIVTRGINLMALKDRKFRLGKAVLELTGPCHPCSRMEENLGHGGYTAMRGHGGWCARILEGGEVKVGDEISFLEEE
jgi:MOSC domain-containing protein YiiM